MDGNVLGYLYISFAVYNAVFLINSAVWSPDTSHHALACNGTVSDKCFLHTPYIVIIYMNNFKQKLLSLAHF